jgi:hypothetical protein
MQRVTIFVVLMLAACQSLPGTAPRPPTTIAECLEQRGDALLYNTGQPHDSMFNSLQSCEAELYFIAQRKARETSGK